MMAETVALVAVGGAVAAVLRHLLTRRSGSFPWGTLRVNCLGAFLLGFLMVAFEPAGLVRGLLVTGFCSTFTTFSSFAWQVVELGRARRVASAAGLVLMTLVLPVVAVWLGKVLGAAVASPAF